MASNKRLLAANTWARSVVNSCDNLEISATVALTSFCTCNSSSDREPNCALRLTFSACNFCNVALSFMASSVCDPIWYDLAKGAVDAGSGAAAGTGMDSSGSGIVVTAGGDEGTSGIGAGEGARKEKLLNDVGPMFGGALLYDLASLVDKPSKASEMDTLLAPGSKGGGPGKDCASMGGGGACCCCGGCCGDIWGLGIVICGRALGGGIPT